MPVKFKRKIVKIGGSYRITIPMEIIQTLKIKSGEPMDIWLDDHRIMMEKSKR
ncbi:MAG: AbrB/MazE/SpoVT family DNA-binding domain-containing protein [Candidatus Bathyarchaeia archaeon]